MEPLLDLLFPALDWAAARPLVLGAIIAGVCVAAALLTARPRRPGAAEGRDPSESTRKLPRDQIEAGLAAQRRPEPRDPEQSTRKLPRGDVAAALAEMVPPPAAEPAPAAMPEPALEAEPAVAEAPEPALEAEPAPVVAPAPEVAPAPARVSLRDRLRRTHDTLVGRLGALVGGRELDAALLEELETILFSADLGVQTAEALMQQVRGSGVRDADGVRELLRGSILERLRAVEPADPWELSGKPHVIVVLGVNGSGKTTTIGKLAAQHAARGRKVILGAGDTFRAAAIEQLQAWGERVGCEVVAGQPGGDPTAVAFDTVKAAIARGADVAIIDTAGRLQTRRPLMEELGKLVRVVGRELEGAPHETLLVLDANTGQNAISQARLFTEAAGVTGLVLTKLDGTAKGGVVVGLADTFGIPVRAVGVGEAVDDLREFSAEEFVQAVFEA